MAGTGLPGLEQRPAFTQPAPLHQSDNGSGQAWQALASVADRVSSDLGTLAAQAEHANKLRYLTDLDLNARAKRIELMDQFRDNPEGFKAAWQGYSKGVIDSVPLEYGKFAQQKLQDQQLDALPTLYTHKFQKDKADAASTVGARMDAAETDLTGLAYRGGINTDQFARGADQARAVLNDAVTAGLMSKDAASIRYDRLLSKAQAEAIVGTAKTLFTEKGAEGGYIEAERLLTDPSLKLSPAEIEHYRGRISAEMNKWAGFQSADLQQAQAQAAIVKDKFRIGAAGLDEVQTAAQRLVDLRDGRGAAELMRGFAQQEVLANDAWQPPDVTARSIIDQRKQARPYVDKVAGAENGGGAADARNPNSSAMGDGQFIDSTWLGLVRRAAPDVAAGKSDAEILALRADRNLSRQMIQAFGDENRAELAARGLPTDDGATYLAHFAGLGGATAVLRADPNTPIKELLTPGAISANAGMKLEGKPFAQWSAGDLRAWADNKMGGGGVDSSLVLAREAANTAKAQKLSSDALGYVAGLRDAPVLPAVDWSNLNDARAALQERQRISTATSAAFRLDPQPVFTKSELDQQRATFNGMNSDVKAAYLGTLASTLDAPRYHATVAELTKDTPGLGWAAGVYTEAPDMAKSIIRGQALIDAKKDAIPHDKDFQLQFTNVLGSAMSGMPDARAAVEAAAKARYADLKSAAGDLSGTADTSVMERAIQDVTGGVVKWSGGFFGGAVLGGDQLVAPRRGLDSSGFLKVLDALTPADFSGAQTAKGSPITPEDFRRLGKLRDYGPGQYLVEIGGGYAMGADGKPYVLDLGRVADRMTGGPKTAAVTP